MLNQIRRTIREKGQGLTEYVLILAFIAGIAFIMFGGNGSLKGTLADTFTETHKILAGLFKDTPDWGHMDVDRDFNSGNQAERLAADQKTLENIAKFFLNKTKGEIIGMLNIDNKTGAVKGEGEGVSADGSVITLGWFVKNDKGGTDFVLTNTESNGKTPIWSYLNPDQGQYMYNWMQGDYGQNGGYKDVQDDTNKYLVSDYPLKNGWTHDDYERGNGVRIILQYEKKGKGQQESDRKVIAAKIAIDPGSQQTTKYGLTNASSGLEVGVKNDGTVKTNINDSLSKDFSSW